MFPECSPTGRTWVYCVKEDHPIRVRFELDVEVRQQSARLPVERVARPIRGGGDLTVLLERHRSTPLRHRRHAALE
eukprot:7850009-Pyramimonas_sp.AAC.1